jgi:tetratricopeptide (TPR) repeat protein
MNEVSADQRMVLDALEQGLALRRAGESEGALEVLSLIVDHFQDSEDDIHFEAVSRAMMGRAMALIDAQAEDDALEALDVLLTRVRGHAGTVFHELRIVAAYEAAQILGIQDQHQQAAEAFAYAIGQSQGDEPAAIAHILAAAHIKLAAANLYGDDVEAAFAALDSLQARFQESDDPAIRHWLDEGASMRQALAEALNQS